MEFLAVEALGQVRDALDALARSDADLARAVIARRPPGRPPPRPDPQGAQAGDPPRARTGSTTWLHLINTARNLERIADHATNIAEAVVYLKEGDIVRRDSARRSAEPA